MRLTLDRREFLHLAGVSLAGTYPIFIGKTALAAAGRPEEKGRDGRILVVVQLSGGNDGLSTVVPYSDPDYTRARTTTRIAERDVLKIDEELGLHPNLKELKALFDEGELAIVQGVSYPNPTRSHFEAMDIWHAGGSRFVKGRTGWLGRAVDAACGTNRPDPMTAVHLGGKIPLALHGEGCRPVAFAQAQGYRWRGGPGQEDIFMKLNSLPEGSAEGSEATAGSLDFLRRVAADARSSSEAVRQASQSYRPAREYPGGNRLAQELRLVAGLIANGLPTRIYYVSLGGFDTHANQRGPHDNLMRVLSSALGVFCADLKAQGLLERVVVLTFSEFGRRVKENGSRGTDHGVAAPMFLLGNRIRGGVHQKHPSIRKLVKGDLAMTVDFRRVYASVLDGWLGVSSEKVLGERYEGLELLRGQARERTF